MKYKVDQDELKKLEDQHKRVQDEISKKPPEVQSKIKAAQKQVQEEIDLINEGFDQGEQIANDWRKAGFLPSEATELLKLMKSKNIGEIVNFKGTNYVLTPFKTVVEAQLYINLIQSRLMELTTTSVEIEVVQLKKTISGFTSLSVFGLMSLAIKRLFKRGN